MKRLIFSFLGLLLLPEIAWSQSLIAPDNTLGAEQSRVNQSLDLIEGGARRGQNLFHSFREFNVGEGLSAYFVAPDLEIQNIFARVTGVNRSEILGIFGTQTLVNGNVQGSPANLFLLNPNGILFGANARLDVGGSFVATTANEIQFGDRGTFSATATPISDVLTVNPSAFLFSSQLAQAPQVQVQGDSQGFRTTTDLIDTQNALRVQENRTLALVGGDLALEGATLKTAGGRIELGSVGPGSVVKLMPVSKGWALDYKGVQSFQDIRLSQQAVVDASGASSGDIQVQGRQIVILDNSLIEASTLREGEGGLLKVVASDSITLKSSPLVRYFSVLSSDVYSTGSGVGGNLELEAKKVTILDGSVVQATMSGTGQGGDVLIKAETLTVSNGSFVSLNTFSSGKGGDLTINADELVEMTGTNRAGENTGLRSGVINSLNGKSGNITINTKHLKVTGSQIIAAVIGIGTSGDLNIRATGSVQLSGEIPSTEEVNGFPGGLFAIVNSNAQGKSGNLTLKTKRLSISDGSKVQTITFGRGNAGALRIEADEVEVFETPEPNIFSTGIFAGVGFDPFQNTELAEGLGGSIEIKTDQLDIRGGSISVGTSGNGNGGNLFIQARDVKIQPSLDPENITSEITGDVLQNATGRGGNITVETNRLSLRDGGRLGSSTQGQGNAGGINIRAKDSVEVVGVNENSISRIVAVVTDTATGNGGNITIQTGDLSIREGGRVAVTTSGQGNAGRMQIYADSIEINGKSANGDLNSRISAAANPNSTGRGGSINLEARKLAIQSGGLITSRSEGSQRAGDISINLQETFRVRNSEISTNSNFASGGNIDITARGILLRDNSNIRTTSDAGNGGNITLNARTIVALEDSNVLAFAPVGKGGQITFVSNLAFLSNPLYRPAPPITDRPALNALLTNGKVDVNASGAVSGEISGVPDISFLQNSLSQLTSENINPDRLVAQTCLVRQNTVQQSSFYATGNTNLPNTPTDINPSTFATAPIQTSTQQAATDRPWKLGDPIVEPTGFYRLANDRLILGRECAANSTPMP